MALILRYRVDPHPGINNEVFDALAKQVGKVGITVGLNIGPKDNPERTQVVVQGNFVSVEGEHAGATQEITEAIDRWNRVKKDKAASVVDAVLNDLTDRRGLRQEWDQIDPEIQEEIRQTLKEIVEGIL